MSTWICSNKRIQASSAHKAESLGLESFRAEAVFSKTQITSRGIGDKKHPQLHRTKFTSWTRSCLPGLQTWERGGGRRSRRVRTSPNLTKNPFPASPWTRKGNTLISLAASRRTLSCPIPSAVEQDARESMKNHHQYRQGHLSTRPADPKSASCLFSMLLARAGWFSW